MIIDGDPGVDDAVALFMALASPELQVLAITTAAGNVGPALTARNARIVREIARREDVPVYAGAARPLVRTPVEAGHFHGETGLGDLPIFEPRAPATAGHAASAIIEAVMSHPPGSVAMAVMGPMTNLALALLLEPAVAGRLGPLAVMGGARSDGGNITASAEYNVHADPHAARVVLEAGCRPVMLGLDATHQVRATPERIAAIAALPGAAAQAVAGLLRFSARVERDLVGSESPPLHDPCTIAWLLRPELFTSRPCRVSVETDSPLTLGHTAVEFRLGDSDAPTAQWVTGADADGVFTLLTERLAGA